MYVILQRDFVIISHVILQRDSVIISHVENPVVVWIQEVTDENTEKLLDLSEQLASLCPAAPKLSGPVQSGKVYAAMFSEDQQWYRCRLKQSLGENKAKEIKACCDEAFSLIPRSGQNQRL